MGVVEARWRFGLAGLVAGFTGLCASLAAGWLMLMAAAAATTLGGADPFIGRWKLNVAKSHYLTGPAPREQTETLSVEGPNLRVRVVGTTADGVKTLVSYWVPYEGGLGHMDAESSSAYDGISGKHLGPREREISRLKGALPER